MSPTPQLNGFILAAGLGTRFRPLTLTVPKPLIPVNGKEVILYSIELMQQAGVTDIVINTHHLSDALEARLGDGSEWRVKIKYSHEPELLGTAGGLKKAAELFDVPATTIVLSSDIVTNAPIESLIHFHREKHAEMTIGLIERNDVTGAGIAACDDSGRVVRYLEKPQTTQEVFSHLVNCSLYVLEPSIIDLIPEEITYDFSYDLFPRLIETNRLLYGYLLPKERGYVIGIDRPELRDQAEHDIKTGNVF